ncbi:MAG: hypothetical protein WBE26_07790, partial [Phycisphaerae bacterium]
MGRFPQGPVHPAGPLFLGTEKVSGCNGTAAWVFGADFPTTHDGICVELHPALTLAPAWPDTFVF